ncbi:hypothetical protein [Glutamicibacter ardleyensis]|uniref:hypothetical protein n=1 Tax=Glutamicibacter ardleyensis TaxID=225894 RepID=UPI003FD4DD8E
MDTYIEGAIANDSLVNIIERGVWQNPSYDCKVVSFNATRNAYKIRELRNGTTFLAQPNTVLLVGATQ